VEGVGEFVARVRGNVGNGIVNWGDDGGVTRFNWLAMAVSMISTTVSSVSVIVGEVMGVVIVVDGRGVMFVFGGSDSSFIPLSALHRP